ncbi:MAG: hypothetical protein K2K96_03650 [Lachnospiraceae bacterium]|nr:hypothetical protein [Lachnospiraceae bacterium]
MNESNAKIQKIQENSSDALILVNIVKIFLIVSTVVTSVVGCSMIWMSDIFDKKFAEASALTDQELSTAIHIEGGLVSGIIDLKRNTESQAVELGINLLATAAVMVSFVVVLHFVAKVFKALKESDSPFRPAIVKNIKIVFVLISILLVLQSGFLIGALVVLPLWCIFLIFEYGCELQQQSDEIL